MPASEREIESAIEKLKSSPGTFQTLVERYAKFTYPHRFKRIVPLGRNPNNVTVKGWPDVYSLAEDFRLCVAEATHSADWPKHLEEDIENAEALGRGRFSSFLFVAWDNEPSPLTAHQRINPRYEKLAQFHKRLVALDVPTNSINFVFKKELIRTLREPRFAAVLKEVLGLSSHSLPFRLIRESQLFGQPDRTEAFAPSESEYLGGLVHRASLADQIEERLEHRGWAWVRGRGAAGKTVLAIQIALDYESKSYPAYYLDLADTELDVAKALDALTTSADDHVLFVVDNVHLNERFARDVFNYWQQVPLGSHLLLLGRDVTVTDVRGTANPLENLQVEALTLSVNPADLAGVFHRLSCRLLAPSTASLTPPITELRRWQSLFGGDLIAFSAAVALRIRQLTQGDWQLRAQDAANYIQEIYLDNASDAERINLLRMAVLAQLEIDLPVEAIHKAGIKDLLKAGLVHRVTKGRDGKYEHFHLIHSGLGDLLLTAADHPARESMQFKTEQLRYVAQQNPFVGHTIARTLELANRKQEAEAVLQSIVELDQFGMTALLNSGLHYLPHTCERLVRFGRLSTYDIDREFAKEPLVLLKAALGTPLGSLVTFLNYAERDLPQAFMTLRSALAQPENMAVLSHTTLRSPLHSLVTFLNYAERDLPQVFIALHSALAQPENMAVLSQTALRSPLHLLVTFLDYCERALPQVFIAFHSALAQPENMAVLSQTALRSPLGHLVTFLDYAEDKFAPTAGALKIVLTQQEHQAKLSDTALRSPLNFLVRFLDYTKRALPQVHTTLQTTLAQPEHFATLNLNALHTPFNYLVIFLNYAQRELPQAFMALQSAFLQLENLATLSQTALYSPLGDLPIFLNYAERELPETFIALQREFAQPENLATLSQMALCSPFVDLVTFLDYAEGKLGPAAAALKILLTQEEHLATLSQMALRTRLDGLTFFLDYAERTLPAVSKSLNSKLAEAESLKIIAGTASREPLSNFLKFLRTASIAPAVVAAIDRNEWDRFRLTENLEQPDFFHGLAKELQRLRRLELAEAPAIALIKTAKPQLWHVPVIGLPQLSEVVRLGHTAGREAILRFLDLIGTPDWLEQQYREVSTGALAASLFRLWGSCEQSVLDHFLVKPLSSRLAAEMKRLDTLKPEYLSAALQLLGSSALIGVYADPAHVNWPETSQVHEAISFASPRPRMRTIGYIQIQLWLGLREMTRLRRGGVMVPVIAGEQILHLWKNSKGHNDKQQTLNAWMIEWLKRCMRSNWVLTADSEC
jgi:hypothetical protein